MKFIVLEYCSSYNLQTNLDFFFLINILIVIAVTH